MPTNTNYMLRRYLLLSVLLLSAARAFATGKTDGNIKMDTHTFFIAFVDTNASFKEVLHLEYNDTGKHKIAIITAPGDSVLKGDSVLLVDSLDFRDFKAQINKVALNHNVGHTLSENSLWEIYYWMFVQIYGNSTPPLSGRLRFAGYVQYFHEENDVNEEDDYETSRAYRQRIKRTDTLLDKQAYYTSKVYAAMEQKTRDSLARATELFQMSANSKDTFELHSYITGFAKNGTLTATQPKGLKISDNLKGKMDAYNSIEKNKKAIKDFFKSKMTDAAVKAYKADYQAIFGSNNVPGDYPGANAFTALNDFLSANHAAKEITDQIETLGGVDQLKGSVDDLEKKYRNDIISLLEKARKDFEKSIVVNDAELKANQEAYTQKIKQATDQIRDARRNLIKQNIGNILNVQIQFERGFVENVKVIVDVDGEPTIFENNMAIGFTSKYNLSSLRTFLLFGRNSNLHIWLADVLRMYDNELDNYTRDYSPADTTISIDPNATPRVFLYKSQFVNLFETKAYTDLEGLSNQQPNGILQIEVSRRLNINTTRYGKTSKVNWGWGNYLYAFGSLNKIEKNQRYLPLHNENVVVNNTLASPSYATSLDFLKYRNLTAGVEANAFTVDFPNMKSTITIDLGAQYGHVPLVDSTRYINSAGGLTVTKDTIKLDGNLITLYPKITLQIFPERRLGLSFTYQVQHTRFLSNNQFRQISSYAKSDLNGLAQEPASRWSHMFEALVKIEVNRSTGSYAFFRSRFFWQQGDVNTFFPQMQVGYSYNLNIVKAINR